MSQLISRKRTARLDRRIAAALTLSGAIALAGCSGAGPSDSAGTTSPAPTTSQAPTASPTPSSSPSTPPELAVPDTVPGEIARSVFTLDGPGGVPENRQIVTDAIRSGVTVTIEGQCVGDRVDWQLLRAAVDDNGTVLTAGTLDCDDPVPATFSSPWEGVAQLVTSPADGVAQAWLVASSDG